MFFFSIFSSISIMAIVRIIQLEYNKFLFPIRFYCWKHFAFPFGFFFLFCTSWCLPMMGNEREKKKTVSTHSNFNLHVLRIVPYGLFLLAIFVTFFATHSYRCNRIFCFFRFLFGKFPNTQFDWQQRSNYIDDMSNAGMLLQIVQNLWRRRRKMK